MAQTIFFPFLLLGVVFILLFASQPWLIKRQVPWHYLLIAGHLVFLLTGLFIGLFAAPLLNLTLTMESIKITNIATTILLICLLALRESVVYFTALWPSVQRSLNTLIVPFAILFVFTTTLNLTALISGQNLYSTVVIPLQPQVLPIPTRQPPLPSVRIVPRPTTTQVLRIQPRRLLRPTATRVLIPTPTPSATTTPIVRRQLIPTRSPGN
ncbi:MAG: hypothetical protein KDE19_10150 [Caldilineaceae bacterium]|nr:hypothetical protein [Caldilineaceae bacterium]